MERASNSTEHEALLAAPLDHFGRADLGQAGGKGANLGELIHAGFPVPPGFVVTTTAYDQFVAHNGLREKIASTLRKQEDSGAAIRAAFENASVSPEVEQAILGAYQVLRPHPVAVRSSATAEDLPEAAFAGQQDTYLNVIGVDALLDAVRRCWASLWSDRAIAYRQRLGLDQQAVKIAVVVQRMAPAEAAGVMFTANTLTGARDEMMIEATPGLGEALVSGLVTADHFILRKQRRGWRVAERRAGRREVIVRARPEGGVEHVEGQATADAAALPDRALHQLAATGAAIQRHFGSPQDIEWAWADGKAYILQARPLTALPTPPPQANRVVRLLASNFGEMLPVRPYPLDMATWIPALGGAVEPLFELLGLDWTLNRMFEGDDGIAVRFSGRLPRPTWRLLLAPARLIGQLMRYDPARWQSDPLLAEAQARARDLEARDPRMLSWEQLLAAVRTAMEIPSLAGEVRVRYFPGAAFAIARLRLLLALLGHTDKSGALLSGAENMTIESNRALEALADLVRNDPALARLIAESETAKLLPALERQSAGRSFLDALNVFMERYGHRETIISSALEPTWKDAPEVVFGIVKSFAVHKPLLDSSQPAWQIARDALLKHPLLRLAPLRATFLQTLEEARTLLPIREDTHYCATLPLPILRRMLLETGKRLAAAKILDAPEDVFHLTLDELERVSDPLPPPSDLAAELRAAMLRRKDARERLASTPLVDPRMFPRAMQEGDELLRGLPGSPGVAEGPARIVRDGSEFDKLVAGDVLVAPYTNPSWTPLFQRAIAVVVDSGSAASHATIVAREYGIPAVMSTITGTRDLKDGERIRVDGSRGAVFRVNPEGQQ